MENTLLEASVSMTTGYRLSPQQRQVWQEQRQAAPANYRAQVLLALNGDVEPARLRAAANAVVARHEILRTSFPRRPGMRTPMQIIHEEPSVSWREEDFSNEKHDRQQSFIEAIVKDETAITFAPDGPSLRLALVRLGANKHRLVLTLPALCADEVSLGVIAKEIVQTYAAVSEPESDTVQYIQFSEWQHELAESENTEPGRAFWREQLSIPALNLPLAISTSLSGDAANRLDPDLSLQLDRVADRCNVPTETLLLACWSTLLWRLTGEETFRVNCVFDGRPYEELRETVGLFARALPLSVHFNEPETMAQLAQRIEERRQQVMEWQEHFDSAAEMTGGAGYEYVKHCDGWKVAGNLEWRVLKQRSEIHRPALGLRSVKTAEGLELELTGVAGAEGLLARLQLLVAAVVENVNQPVSVLPIVAETEWKYLVHELSHSNQEVGDSQNFLQLFESAAQRFSNHVAVTGEDQELSYAELDRLSNQLARYLQRLGVKPEARVAICMERSTRIVVALLGVLKAGGAYVPLDLNYPRKQLSLMLEDAAPLVLLTQQNLLPLIPEHTGRNLCLDSEWATIDAESIAKPLQSWTNENLAYVIYTSGSTGAPKGVGIEHQQLQNYLRGIGPRLDLPAGASYATVSTFAADLGHTVIFSALASGGCLHVISQERATNPDALAGYFGKHRIDCLKIVPSHLEALLATSTPEKVLPRRCLVLGGETLRADLINRIEAIAPDCRIINHYGPTETTVGVLSYKVGENRAKRSASTVPLGRPLSGTQIYLLDQNLSPAPIGVAATLYVGGESLARGYLNRQELTAQRFVPNPFGAPGTRLYHTGDVARYLPDGNIEFLGRNDSQVKIHGYRVELGEIECALLQHESVREAAVIIRNDAGEQRLAAYIVGRQNYIPTASELRDFLKARLAAHLIPSDFVRLESLPLNLNGKVDRRALPESSGVSLELQKSFVEPRTAVEEVLAGIWSDVLKTERVGAEDNFFALGGHSLAAMQVMARIRKIFQVELSLRSVFDATTVASLAQAVAENESEPGLSERKARLLQKLQAMSPEEKEALRNRQKGREPSGAKPSVL